MRMATPSLLIAIALAAPVGADEIRLVNGGLLRGRIVEQTPERVVIEVGPGRITLPADRIGSIERGRAALDVWLERRAALDPSDAEGWLSLGLWARDQGLATQARECFERVVQLQPANPIANGVLGRVRVGDRWMSEDEAYLSRGYVRYLGRWVPREERDAALQASSAAEERRAARAEADARVREAEARAREAEARAAAAEAAAASAPGPYSPGTLGLVVGASPYPYGFSPGRQIRHVSCPPPPAPLPEPERRTHITNSLR